MSACYALTFTEKGEAVEVKRKLIRNRRLNTTVTYCTECDKYHVVADVSNSPVDKDWLLILNRIAQGFQAKEIAPELKVDERRVEYITNKMMKHFYALSRANLVAIGISLGLVDPSIFVPGEDDHRR